jgi:hypothetical protein
MGLYQFTEKRWKGSSPIVCLGPLSAMRPLIDREELKTVFGGYVVYESGAGDKYIGVWGRRKASRLRRMLRERGCTFHLLPGHSEDLRVNVISVHYGSSREIAERP